VLLSAVRGWVQLPSARWTGGPPDSVAATLEREAVQSKSGWARQVFARAVHQHPLRASLSITYLAAVADASRAPERARWFAVTKLPRLVPACHRESITHAIAFASTHADRWELSLALLPAEFTLTQLQQAHEALLGRRLYKASFRRAAKSVALITPTGAWRAEGRGRPAQLYRRARGATR
jgi:hypothetical protein